MKTVLQINPGTQIFRYNFQTTAKTVETALLDLLGTKAGLHKHLSIYTWVKTALQIFTGTEAWLHELHWTSNAVKTSSSDFLDTKTSLHELHSRLKTLYTLLKHGCPSFTTNSTWWKWIFSALKQTCTSLSFTWTLQGQNGFTDLSCHWNMPGPPTRWKWLHLTSLKWACTPGEKGFSCHWNMPEQASNDFQYGWNGFIGRLKHKHRLPPV